MKLQKHTVVKALIGLGLVVLAAMLSIAIRDALAFGNPESSLPAMDVVFGDSDDKLPSIYIRRDKYIWNYLYGPREGGGEDLEVWREIESGWVPPNAPLSLEFTYKTKDVSVSVATPYSTFRPLQGSLFAPEEPGEYIYKVDAGFGKNKVVTYYFRIRVPEWGKGGAG